MSKSATGTEYVNAQIEELRLIIDDLASKIKAPQTEDSGLVYEKIFTGTYAYVGVTLIVELRPGQSTKCTLRVGFAQWNGSETYQGQTVTYYGSINVDKKGEIPAAYRPTAKVSHSGQLRTWYESRPPSYNGDYNIEAYPDGRLHVLLNGNGYEVYSLTYYV